MSSSRFKYVIIGGGLAGASAVDGIREIDHEGSILLIGNENHMPYDRPPLTKQLWFGKKQLPDIFIHPDDYYLKNHVTVKNGTTAVAIDPAGHKIVDDTGAEHAYNKLLLATGGIPRRLTIPGGISEGIFYYRYIDDYISLRQQATEGKTATVIGGGFIGAEIAAALTQSGVKVTMVYPESHILSRIFPEDMGNAIQQDYISRGVIFMNGTTPTSIEKSDAKFITTVANGEQVQSDIVVVGVGISPSIGLASAAGLANANGIVVDDRLQASEPDVYAAGDNALFPYRAIESVRRVEHWDNALNQGKQAGRNMAGANEPYLYMPYFYSDLFDFGFEAVGDISSKMDVFADWIEPYRKGVVYFLRDGKVKGAMNCAIWGKLDEARALILSGDTRSPEDLRGAITE